MKFVTTALTLATLSIYTQTIASSIPTASTVTPSGPLIHRLTLAYDTNHQLFRRGPPVVKEGGIHSANPSNMSFHQMVKSDKDAFKKKLGTKLLASQMYMKQTLDRMHAPPEK
ncbi:hypothetical protein BJ085DRAFT_39916 [Dimargaris cristalligena]|uniref:Uncharacterized protein n=1 Tax=Dimargaris cristalligena TaxID=215637 RepID=A0A4P9ZKD4_9FUNG|nr:hypothetical protein BJ085DRAFT_39916 [Dimargaris cristalligena]|eukprot:RKP33545.1 hypothetical protein BJ085DRAFT_39916 [Dimargaris cristalligena]